MSQQEHTNKQTDPNTPPPNTSSPLFWKSSNLCTNSW